MLLYAFDKMLLYDFIKYGHQMMIVSLWFSLLPELSLSHHFKACANCLNDIWKLYPFDKLDNIFS